MSYASMNQLRNSRARMPLSQLLGGSRSSRAPAWVLSTFVDSLGVVVMGRWCIQSQPDDPWRSNECSLTSLQPDHEVGYDEKRLSKTIRSLDPSLRVRYVHLSQWSVVIRRRQLVSAYERGPRAQ